MKNSEINFSFFVIVDNQSEEMAVEVENETDEGEIRGA